MCANQGSRVEHEHIQCCGHLFGFEVSWPLYPRIYVTDGPLDLFWNCRSQWINNWVHWEAQTHLYGPPFVAWQMEYGVEKCQPFFLALVNSIPLPWSYKQFTLAYPKLTILYQSPHSKIYDRCNVLQADIEFKFSTTQNMPILRRYAVWFNLFCEILLTSIDKSFWRAMQSWEFVQANQKQSI